MIAFCRDWDGPTSSNHHVLRELAKTRRVVWLNSTPRGLRSNLSEAARGPVRVENDLWVATPLVFANPRPLVRTLDHWLIESFIRAIKSRLGIEEFQLWSFLPNMDEYIGLGEVVSVYYCVDLVDEPDREAMLAAERRLMQKVDCVFAVNHALADAKREVNPTTFVAPHGVDHELFASALDAELPADLAWIPGPRIGFHGVLRDYIDTELIARLALARPAWSFVFVGRHETDVSELERLPNVHLLGPRRHEQLPAYCAGFDVGLIPYRMQPRMAYVNPLEFREYLAAGLPVVATSIDEVARYPEHCQIANSATELVEAIERALACDSHAQRKARSAEMLDESWEARIEMIEHRVDECAEGILSARGRRSW